MVKILCVDDEPFILNSIERIFSEDFDIFKATSGADALELIAEHQFSVIISDQRMPGMSGTEFLELARDRAPQAIRILLTGYADLEAVRSAVNDGEVYRYVTKPWNNSALRSVVQAGVLAARSGDAAQLAVKNLTRPGQFSPILVIDSDLQVYETCQAVVGKDGIVTFAGSIEHGLAQLAGIKDLGIVVACLQVGRKNTELLIKSIKTFHPSIVTILVAETHDADVLVRLINESQIFRCLFKPTRGETIHRMLINAQIRHEALEKSSELLARFQVPVPAEIKAAQKSQAEEAKPLAQSWTKRFASLFSRTPH